MTKILLVEDDKSLREIYGVRLLAEGYDIVSAGDGEEALAMAIKERPQLIVSDVMMPKISGFDMLDILRSTTETKDIKVIMMTALSSEDQRARGQALGADRYLVKSQVGIEDVVRTVHEVLGDAPTSRPASFGGPASSAGARPATPSVPQRPTPSFTAATSPAPSPVATPAFSGVPPQAPAAPNLPQPTAPFSTTRPANLGERVIHPITPVASPSADISSRIDEELQNTGVTIEPPTPPAPAAPSQPIAPPQPTAPVSPSSPATPAAPTASPTPPASNPLPPEPPQAPTPPPPPPVNLSGIQFEETPRPPQPPK